LLANVELPEDADEALARGAEGVGLLRTEYLYFQHHDIPSEEEQVAAYADVLRRMAGRPVIMRTLDVGGDKVTPLSRRQAGVQPVPWLARHPLLPGKPAACSRRRSGRCTAPPCTGARPDDVPDG